MTLTQGHGCGIDIARLQNKVRTTHSITSKLGHFIALVMVITWLDFGKVIFQIVILANFVEKFGMCHISGMVGPIDVKQKGSASVGYWV